MSILTEIIGGNVATVAERIVGLFKLSPTAKAEIESQKADIAFKLAQIQLEMEARTQEAISREVEAAGQNIRAEAASGDKYTSRARPTFLYICEFILLWNYIVTPLAGRQPVLFPEPLFWLFGSVMLGYVGGRSWEKISGMKGSPTSQG